MTAEELLLGLEACQPLVLLCPTIRLPGRSIIPVTPTHALRRYRRLGPAYLKDDVALMPDMKHCHLQPWGWCEVVEPTVLMADEEMGGEFPGTKGLAYTLARVDEVLVPMPVGKEWWLVHELLPGMTPMLTSCAFWLRSRHRAFLAVLEELANEKEPKRQTAIFGSS